jgi:hypothetical protein
MGLLSEGEASVIDYLLLWVFCAALTSIFRFGLEIFLFTPGEMGSYGNPTNVQDFFWPFRGPMYWQVVIYAFIHTLLTSTLGPFLFWLEIIFFVGLLFAEPFISNFRHLQSWQCCYLSFQVFLSTLQRDPQAAIWLFLFGVMLWFLEVVVSVLTFFLPIEEYIKPVCALMLDGMCEQLFGLQEGSYQALQEDAVPGQVGGTFSQMR